MIDFQSPTMVLRPCPPGTFENSPAIYGWVHFPNSAQSPEGTAENLHSLMGLKYWILDSSVHLRAFALAVQPFRSRLPKTIQGYSRPFNPIQAFWKKIIYFLFNDSIHYGPLRPHPPEAPRPFKAF
jgi:hypothetical protein